VSKIVIEVVYIIIFLELSLKAILLSRSVDIDNYIIRSVDMDNSILFLSTWTIILDKTVHIDNYIESQLYSHQC